MALHRRGLLLAGLGATLAAPRITLAQGADGFPNKPVRVVIGFPPGGGVDTIARPTFQRLSDRLGVPVLVDNRAGNNGNIAMDHVAKSAPDGYTLFFGNVGNYTTHALFPNLTFDTLRDFAFISQVTFGPLVFAVRTDFPAQTLQQLMEMAKARPGTLNFGSGGSGGVPHFAFEIWRQQMGLDIVHVPYRGSGPAFQDLMGGRVQMMIDGYGVVRGAHEAGQVRVLAITSARRHPEPARRADGAGGRGAGLRVHLLERPLGAGRDAARHPEAAGGQHGLDPGEHRPAARAAGLRHLPAIRHGAECPRPPDARPRDLVPHRARGEDRGGLTPGRPATMTRIARRALLAAPPALALAARRAARAPATRRARCASSSASRRAAASTSSRAC